MPTTFDAALIALAGFFLGVFTAGLVFTAIRPRAGRPPPPQFEDDAIGDYPRLPWERP